jgi:hypothetical protein
VNGIARILRGTVSFASYWLRAPPLTASFDKNSNWKSQNDISNSHANQMGIGFFVCHWNRNAQIFAWIVSFASY